MSDDSNHCTSQFTLLPELMRSHGYVMTHCILFLFESSISVNWGLILRKLPVLNYIVKTIADAIDDAPSL